MNTNNRKEFNKNGHKGQNFKQGGGKFNKNNHKNKPKFQPFKKHDPIWKQMDEEISRLTAQYEQV